MFVIEENLNSLAAHYETHGTLIMARSIK